MSKTINEALKDVFLELGGDPTALSDNQTVSDYIEDLAEAIKAETGSVIDDTEASETKTYSSSKVENLVEGVLPSVTATDNGKVLTVVSGEWQEANAPSNLVDFGLYNGYTAMFIQKATYQQVKESSIIKVNFSADQKHYYFVCNKQDADGLGFVCVVRTSNSTIFHTFSVKPSATSDVQEVTITSKTVNDPA